MLASYIKRGIKTSIIDFENEDNAIKILYLFNLFIILLCIIKLYLFFSLIPSNLLRDILFSFFQY